MKKIFYGIANFFLFSTTVNSMFPFISADQQSLHSHSTSSGSASTSTNTNIENLLRLLQDTPEEPPIQQPFNPLSLTHYPYGPRVEPTPALTQRALEGRHVQVEQRAHCFCCCGDLSDVA